MNGKKAKLARKILKNQLAAYNHKIKHRKFKIKIKEFIIHSYYKIKFYIKYFYNVNIKGLVYRKQIRSMGGACRRIKNDIKKKKQMPNYCSERRYNRRKRNKR